MKNGNILPIGSAVLIKGKPSIIAIIIARIVVVKVGEELNYFDYAGCIYPRGVIGDQMVNFNSENIEKVLHEGYTNDLEMTEKKKIMKWFELNSEIRKANLKNIAEKIQEKNQNN